MFLGDLQLGKPANERSRAVICESFLALPLLLRGTQLVATLPSRLATRLQATADLRLVALPLDSPEFVECMAWSPLYSEDPGHQWLRSVLAELAGRI
jgi:LysR family transcriptional regulator, nod-box dependent transcriptional activator